MDARLQVFLCLAGGGGFFAVLGGLFGAIAGTLYWRSGQASGTSFGLRVARTFDRVAETRLTPGVRGAITGAADGVLFLGTLGLLVGGFVAYSGLVEVQWLFGLARIVTALVAAALVFGVLAYALTGSGIKGLAPVSVSGVLGAFEGVRTAGTTGLIYGLLLGLLAGTACAWWLKRSRSQQRTPDQTEDLE